MPKFKIDLPDGRSVNVDAPSAQAAAEGAATWAKANPPSGMAKARADARQRVSTAPGPIRSISQGASLGFSDELEAGSAALETGANNLLARVGLTKGAGYTMGEAYRAVADEERAQQRQFAQRHPLANVAGQIVGGMAAPGAKLAAGFVAKGGNLLGASVRSAAVGAGYGAVAGAGGADGDLGQRARGAGKGAVTGAVVGAAMPAAARAAQTVGRAVNAATGYRLGGGVQAAAMSRLRQALQQDGVDAQTIAQAQAEYARTGAIPPSLIDVAGENTRALIRAAGSRPGAARNAAQTYRDTTVESVPDASINRARQLTPNEPRPAAEVSDSLEASRRATANANYAGPYSQMIDVTPEMASALRGEPGRAAIARARAEAVANQEYGQIAELDALLNGDLSSFPQISAATADRIRIAMQGRATRAGAQPGGRNLARGFSGRADAIDGALGDVEGLQPARAAYRAQSQAIEGLNDIGPQILRSPPDEFAAQLEGLPPQAIDAARVGARQALTDALGQRANASGLLNQIAFAPNTRRNLVALFGEDEANRFIQAARLNLQKARNANYVAPNTGSQTQSRTQDQNILGNVLNAVRDPVQAILNRLANGLTLTDEEARILVQAGISPPNAAALSAPAANGNVLAGRVGVAIPAQAGGAMARR